MQTILKKLSFYSIEKWFILALTPLYLSLVYYKSVMGADLVGLLIVSLTVFLLYLPIEILVSQSGRDLSIEAIVHDKEIVSYLRALFLPILFAAVLLAIVYFTKIRFTEYNLLIALALYIMWLRISSKLLTIMLHSEPLNLLKMIALLFFIIALVLVNYTAAIPHEFGFFYLLALAGVIFKTALGIVIAMPMLVFGLFGAFAGTTAASRAHHGGSTAAVFPGLLFTVLIITVPLIDWFSNFVNGIDAYTASVSLSIVLILMSAFGAYFQIRILTGSFISSSKKTEKIGLVFLALFYGVMMMNMHLADTIDNNSKKIKTMQFKVKSFNKSIQDRF